MGEHELALKICNVVSYLSVIGVHALLFYKHCGGSDGDDDNSLLKKNDTDWHKADTYLTPPLYANAIFGLIKFLLGGFVIYQWFNPAKDAVIEGIGWDYVISSALNISFALVWVFTDIPIINSIIALCLVGILSKIYHNIIYYPPKNVFDRLFIHWSFTMYLSWMTVETVSVIWITVPFLNTVLFSTIMLVIYGVIGLHFVDYYDRQDVVYAGTLVWGLLSLAKKDQDVKALLISASISAGLIISGIIRVWVHKIAAWYRLRNERLGERDPLLRSP